MVLYSKQMSQMERLVWIDKAIRAKGGVSAAQIAERFEVSARQAKRDIEYLKWRIDAPIQYDRKKKLYIYREPFDGMEFADEHVLLDIAFLRALADQSAYLPFLSERLKACLSKEAGVYAGITSKLRYELPDREHPSGQIARALCRSMKRSVLTEIAYLDAKGHASRRSIQPLRLLNYGGKWYCLSHDLIARDFRTFALARIKEAVETDEASPPPPSDKDIEAFLSSSYGIFKGKPLGRARLRFSGGAARAVRGQVWHEDQRIVVVREEPNPEIELELPVHDWTELLGRALRCGSQCQVIGPPAFREEWQREIEAMAALASEPGEIGNREKPRLRDNLGPSGGATV